MKQKIDKIFFAVFLFNCFELGVANSLNSEEDTCHRESMC